MRRIVLLMVAVVLVAPRPALASDTTDTFTRELKTSWGTGPLGAWTLETTFGPALSLSVSGGAGRAYSAFGLRRANLFVGPSVGGALTVRATVSSTKQPSKGPSNQWQLLLRRSGIRTYYTAALIPEGKNTSARLTIQSAKAGVYADLAVFTLPFSIDAGATYRMAASVTDSATDGTTTVVARAWPADAAEPSAWQATATDGAADRLLQGSPGIRLSTITNGVSMSIDDVVVSTPDAPPPPPPPPPTLDPFDRVAVSGWGTGPLGAWTWETSSGAPLVLSVDGATARAFSAAGLNKGNALLAGSRSGTTRVRATFSVDSEPATGAQNHWHVVLRHAGIRTYYSAYLLATAGGGPATLAIMSSKDGVFDTPVMLPLAFAVVPGVAYDVEALVSDIPEGTLLQARAWPHADPAPADWQGSWTDTAANRILAGQVGVRISLYASPATATVDDFSVTNA